MKLHRFFYILLCSIFICTPLLAEDTIHIVQKSETLYSLSRKYGVTVAEIQKANNMGSSNAINIGQKLIIPFEKEESKSENTSTTVTKPVAQYKDYTVVKGDTLYSIAKNNNLTVDKLREINNLSTTSILKIGQVLNVPNSSTTAVTNPTIPQITINTEDPRETVNKKGDTSLIWPVKAKEVEYKTGKISGVALTGTENESVKAIRSGTVTFSGMYRGFGQVVFIQDASDYIYVYTGLSKISVKNGDKVDYGQSIGTIGHDSFTNEDSMDFMVYKNSKSIDPATAPRG